MYSFLKGRVIPVCAKEGHNLIFKRYPFGKARAQILGKESPQTNLYKEFQTKKYPQLAVNLIFKYSGEGLEGGGRDREGQVVVFHS